MSKEFKAASRDPFSSTSPHVSEQQIQIGCLQRIADATEKMAMSYTRLIDERDYLKRQNDCMAARAESLKRSLAAMKGLLNKAKREILELKEQTAGKEGVTEA